MVWTSRLWRRLGGLPAGSAPITAGLAVSAATSYGFVVMSARILGPEAYGPLAVLWSLVFTLGPGLFFPLEQEISREITARRVTGSGTRPVVRRAAVLGLALVTALAAAALVTSGFLVPRLFGGQPLLLVALLISFLGYSAQHTVRGLVAAERRFGAYGQVIGIEGVLRVAPLPLVAVAGVAVAGPFGLVLGVAPLAATAVLLWHLRRRPVPLDPGPLLPWAALLRAVGYLLAGSVLGQLLINAPQIAVELLATEAERADTGRFFTALVLARVPLFLFAAIQASQLPRLTGHAERRDRRGFRTALLQLAGLVGGLGLLALGAGVALGPAAVGILFGEDFRLARTDFAYLSGATAAYLVALALSQGLVALCAHRAVPAGWAVGLAAFGALLLREQPLLLRVEQATLGGCVVAATAMVVLVALRLRGDASRDLDRAAQPPVLPPVEP